MMVPATSLRRVFGGDAVDGGAGSGRDCGGALHQHTGLSKTAEVDGPNPGGPSTLVSITEQQNHPRRANTTAAAAMTVGRSLRSY